VNPVDNLTIDADLKSVRRLDAWLAEALEALELRIDEPTLATFHLAIHEILTNCVDHATRPGDQINVAAQRIDDTARPTLRIEISDTGEGTFVGTSVSAPSPDEPQVRGYGLMIAEQVASSVLYERLAADDPWTNRWVLVFDNDQMIDASPDL